MRKAFGILGLLLVIFVITGLIEPNFYRVGNLVNLARWTGLYGILAIGVSFVIITGGIDLSIGSLIGLSGALFPLLVVHHSISTVSAACCVLGISLGIGFLHGVLITKLRLQPFVVTLCGLFIYRGLARYVTGESNQGFGNDHEALRLLIKYKLFGLIPMPFILLILLGIIASILLNRLVFGRHLFAVGFNPRAARYSGIDTDKVTITAYVICSTIAGLGGMLFALDQNSVQPSTFGNFYELYAIAGAVLGGCSLRGGEGTMLGVICGAAMVEVIKNAAFFLDVATESEFTVIGVVILLGVIADELFTRYAQNRRIRIPITEAS